MQESESEPEEDNVLTDISELSVQEVKLCLKEPLGFLQPASLCEQDVLTLFCFSNNRGYSVPARFDP